MSRKRHTEKWNVYIVTRSSHPMNVGSLSPFIKKGYRVITVASFLNVLGQTIHSFRFANTLFFLFSGNSSSSNCHSSNIYLFVHVFKVKAQDF